jgi:hypothetical protein
MKSRTLSLLAYLVTLLGRGATPVDGWIDNPKQGESRGTQRRQARQPAVC